MSYQRLFDFFSEEHGLTLLESEIQEIIYEVLKHQGEGSPITPAALENIGFWEVDTEYIFRWDPDGPEIQVSFIKIPNGEIVQVDCYDGPSFPGVSTIEDLKTLLRFLGHEIKEEANAD